MNDAAIHEVIQKAVTSPTTAMDRALATYMTSCIAYQSAPGASWGAALQPAIDRMRSEARTQGISAALGQSILDGSAPFFVAYASIDQSVSLTKETLEVGPPGGYVTSFDVDASALAPTVAALYPDALPSQQAALVDLVVKVDTLLAAIAANETLEEHPIGLAGLKLAAPHVDWAALLTASGAPASPSNVSLSSLDAITKVDEIIGSLSTADLLDFLEFKVRESWSASAPTVGAGDATAACETAAATDLVGIVEYRFVDTVIGKANVTAATALAKAVLAAFEKRLETTPFLDDATRVEARLKASQMTIEPLASPRDSYDDVTLVVDSYATNLLRLRERAVRRGLAVVDHVPDPKQEFEGTDYTETEAYYDDTSNSFTILPGIAHGRYFGGKAASPSLNFGSLGWVAGHEMTHGFDSNGRFYDGHGAMRDWWTSASAAAFTDRSTCFVKEYSGFADREAPDPVTMQPELVDGARTLAENIADNGGIRNAHDAAAPYLAKLSSVSGFTPEQQFFLSAAQNRCEKRGADYARESLAEDVHSPRKARVNISFSNYDAFASAFSCKAGDSMVAAPACSIW